ncbi:C10 family peptidase [bacterium]|nr:C10 family peptidase [bacterium]
MKRLLLVSLLSLLVLSPMFAAPVDRETAETAAVHFMLRHNDGTAVDYRVDDVHLYMHEGFTACYIVNLQPAGVVIVSGDDLAVPVLMYSGNGHYDGSALPPALENMLITVAKDLRAAIEAQLEQPAKTAELWEDLLEDDTQRSAYFGGGNSIMSVSPMLSTTWNQTFPYNKDCPTTATGGSGGHVYTGCVATAMAQVMKFWNFPTTGVGSHSYTHATYGLQSANFGNTTYAWSSMPNSVSGSSSTTAKNAIGTLMYHCGVSVEMDYGPSGSASSIFYSYQVMPVFFRYKSSISYRSRSNYSNSSWLGMLTAELNGGRPVLYRGSQLNGSGGHAFVVDGFTGSDYFHMNFGWGGYLDGYFYLDNITPGSNSFNYHQAMVIGIEPDASPPPSPVSPTNLSSNLCTSPTFTWSAASGANSYRLQVATDQNFNSTVYDNASLTGTSAQVSGLSPATTYYWRMNATGSSGTSVWTSTWNFTTVNASISASGPTSFCDGGSVQLSTTTVSGAAYMWTLDGVPVQGANLPVLTAMQDGDYRVQISIGGCNTLSAPQTVNVYPMPTAEILPLQNTAICAGGSMLLFAQQGTGYSYQWSKDGQDIPGATTSSFAATESGTYAVTTSANGCSSSSTSIAITVYPIDPVDLVWTGAVDDDWQTSGNWDNPCAIPTAGDNVTIPASCTPPASIPASTLQNLTIENAAGVDLSGNLLIAGTLTLTDGSITLGDNDLTIGVSGEIVGGSAGSNIITDGTGVLRQLDIGSTGRFRQILYPVANAAGDYIPCYILNTASLNDFAVRVTDEVLDGGVLGSPLTQGVVQSTWLITGGSGSTNCNLSFAWPSTAEASGFDRSSCFISTNDNGQNWNALHTPTTAQGGDPYTMGINGVQSLSALGTPFAIGSTPVLYPVELLSFNADVHDGTVLLHWATASETNNHGFMIERSKGNEWQTLGFVPSRSLDGEGRKYSWTDTQAGSGMLRYRLRQIDLDGSANYSPVITVQSARTLPTTLSPVAPQPARSGDVLRIQLQSGSDAHYRLVLFDLLGRPVATVLDDNLNAGAVRQLSINTTAMHPGTYFLQLQGGGTTLLRRISLTR